MKVTDKYLKKFAQRRANERRSALAFFSITKLSIDRKLYRDEVVYALGYPDAQDPYEAVKSWIQDNDTILQKLSTKEALLAVHTKLSHKLDLYFYDTTWHHPEQHFF